MVLMTSCRLACLANWYSPNFNSSRVFASRALTTNVSGLSMTPSVTRRSAMSRIPRRGGILTILSFSSGPGASKRCFATTNRIPPAIAIRINTVNTALPAMTRGWRTLSDRRVGIWTRSGSRAALGLRGVIRLISSGGSPDVPRRSPGTTSRDRACTAVSRLTRATSCGISLEAASLESAIHTTHSKTDQPTATAASSPTIARKISDELCPFGDYSATSIQCRTASIVKAPKYQRRIGATKPERVRQYHIDFAFARPVRHQVNRSLDRRMVEVERRWRNFVAHRQNRKDGLDGAGGTQQVAGRRFGGRHGNVAGLVADQPLHRIAFDLFTARGPGCLRAE